MMFNSINFIFIFLPAFLLSYYFASDSFKNVIIFIFSVLFYIIGNINNVANILVLIVLTIINYYLYYIIHNENDLRKKRIKTIISIGFNLYILILFKSEILTKTMPLGLSFYTFHFISLLVDSYKSDNTIEKLSFGNFAQYILFFPKLLSGPITRHKYFDNTYNDKKYSLNNLIKGIYLFSIGLALKCLLSDNIGNIINQINTYGYDSISIGTAWIGMFCFTMKLYFDFAGYSLMAIGIAKAIGIKLPDNFNLPFVSKSISEFWRRWHITLGHFFRDYVYIPLGGNCGNKNLIRQSINIIIVWILTGLWHGFKLNYIIWAMLICLVIIFEKVFLNKIYNRVELIGRIIVILFMPFAFLIFSIEDLNLLKVYITKLFDISTISNGRELLIIWKLYWKIFLIGILFMTSIPKKILISLYKNKACMIILTIILIILSCYMINISSGDVFKYFTF